MAAAPRLAARNRRSRQREEGDGQPLALVFFSDGSVTRSSAAAATVMHMCASGDRADARNRVEQMRWSLDVYPLGRDWPRLRVTPGAMEAAGIALSLHRARHYIEGAEGCPPLDITIYCDNKPIVGFVIDQTPSSAGAHHLEGLVNYIGAQMDETRQAGHRLAVLWAPRSSRGVKRAHALAHDGPPNPWPGRLQELLLESSEVVAAADEDARNVMMRF